MQKFRRLEVATARSSLKKGFPKFPKYSGRLVKILAIPIKKYVKKLVFTKFTGPTRLQLCLERRSIANTLKGFLLIFKNVTPVSRNTSNWLLSKH